MSVRRFGLAVAVMCCAGFQMTSGASVSCAADGTIVGRILDFLGVKDKKAAKAVQQEVVVEIQAAIPDKVENQYLIAMLQLVTQEIHFVRKVCHPNEKQLAEISQVGLAQAETLAKMLADPKNRSGQMRLDVRQMMTEALQKKIEEIMPAASASEYRRELAARFRARREAAQGMMMLQLDHRFTLTPQQSQKMSQEIERTWDEQWGRNLTVHLYDRYAPLPSEEVLKKVLNERQQAVWKARNGQGAISFGWEQDLGLKLPWGNVPGLEELDEYPGEGSQ